MHCGMTNNLILGIILWIWGAVPITNSSIPQCQ